MFMAVVASFVAGGLSQGRHVAGLASETAFIMAEIAAQG
jgi:hypothetical protein